MNEEALASASEGIAGAFIDSLWLEEGLSRNTLDAYRRDLVLLGQWLAGQGKVLSEATEADLNGYFAARHGQTRATTANRRLTVFKRYFRWALRERLLRLHHDLTDRELDVCARVLQGMTPTRHCRATPGGCLQAAARTIC